MDAILLPDTVAQAYDHWASRYDSLYLSPRCQAEDRHLAQLLRRFLQGINHVLDVGCGTGAFLRLTHHPTHYYLGIDISAGMLEQAQAAYPDAAFLQTSIEDGALPRGQFGAVVSLYSPLSYVRAPLAALCVIRDALQPGGRCFLMVNAPRWHARCPQRAGIISLQTQPAAWSAWQARERVRMAGLVNVRLTAFSVLPAPLLGWEGPLARRFPQLGRYLIIEATRG